MSSMCHNDSGSGGEKHNLDHNILACILTYDHSSKITAIGLFNFLEAYQKVANALKREDTTQPEGYFASLVFKSFARTSPRARQSGRFRQ